MSDVKVPDDEVVVAVDPPEETIVTPEEGIAELKRNRRAV